MLSNVGNIIVVKIMDFTIFFYYTKNMKMFLAKLNVKIWLQRI